MPNLLKKRQQTTALAFTKKREYFAGNIEECNGNIKTLFNCLNKLLDDKRETVLPSHDFPLELAERFKLYFKDKICNIRKSFFTINAEICHTSPFPGDVPLTSFEPTTEHELKSIILTYGVNCSPEDPIPVTSENSFISIWMDIVNLSLSQGCMECLKNAISKSADKETRPFNRNKRIKKL